METVVSKEEVWPVTRDLVPDVVEPLIGWRCLRLFNGELFGQLGHVWQLGATVQTKCRFDCENSPCPPPRGTLPYRLSLGRLGHHTTKKELEAHPLGHGCGIYGYKEAEPVASEMRSILRTIPTTHTLLLMAETSLWGKVYEHEDGYRAQYGRVKKLYASEYLWSEDYEDFHSTLRSYNAGGFYYKGGQVSFFDS